MLLFLERQGCIGSHEGIEEIRGSGKHHVDADKKIGKEIGDLYGCITCHGGYPKGLTSKVPHKGASAP